MKKLRCFSVILACFLSVSLVLVSCSEPSSNNNNNDGGNNNGGAPTPITSVNVTITAPVKGAAPVATASGTGNFTIGAVTWSPANNSFLANTAYTAAVTLTANSGFTFSGLNSATVNGQNATISGNIGTAVTLSYTFPVTSAKSVTSIAIKAQPTKLTYMHGELLDLTGLVVTLTYEDASTEDVAAASFAVKNITANPAQGVSLVYPTHNDQPITITYGNLAPLTTNNLIVTPIPITSAEVIATAPVKGVAPATMASGTGNFTTGGVSWEPTTTLFLGGTVYTVAVTLTANSGYTFTGISSATINGQNAIVSNNTGEAATLSYTFPMTDERTVTDIIIKTQPTKLNYTHGDSVELAGLVVTLAYDDTTTEDVDAADFADKNITANPSHGNNLIHLEHNNQPVTITYGNLILTTSNLFVIPKVITFVVDPIPVQIYSGNEIRPAVMVRDGTTALTTADYTAAYANNIDAGTADVTITGEGNYAGSSGSATFTILQTVSPGRIEYYWVDEHSNLVTTSGGVVTVPQGQTLTITAQSTGYIVKQWHLNGVNTGQSGNTYNFSSMTTGKQIVALIVEKDGKLYNTNITITVVATRTVTIDMYDSNGDGWDNDGALRINVNGVQVATNVRVSSGYNDTYTFSVTHGDVVQLYWVVGSYQSENSFIVYYADTPPSPTFTTSNNSSWSGTNALIYRLRGSMNNISGGTLLGSFTVQ